MAKRGTKAGDFYVEGHVDAEQLKAGMKDARTTVEQETAAMGDAVENNTAKKFQDASGKVTAFIGSITAIAGTFYLFRRLGTAIGDIGLGWVRAKDAAHDYRLSLKDLGTDELRAETARLNDEVVSWWSNIKNWGLQATDAIGLTIDASREARLAILEEATASRQVAEAEERRLELARKRVEVEKRASERRQSIFEENQQLEIDALNGEERIRAERARAERDLQRRIADESDAIAEARLQYQLELIGRKYDAELRAFRDAEAEKERLARESVERQARALADAVSAALDNVLKQQFTAQNFAGPVEEMLRRIENQVMALKHRGGL